MIINGFEVKHIVLRDKDGNNVAFIGEEEVINNTDLEIWYTPKYDANFNQKLVTGKNNEVNI